MLGDLLGTRKREREKAKGAARLLAWDLVLAEAEVQAVCQISSLSFTLGTKRTQSAVQERKTVSFPRVGARGRGRTASLRVFRQVYRSCARCKGAKKS